MNPEMLKESLARKSRFLIVKEKMDDED